MELEVVTLKSSRHTSDVRWVDGSFRRPRLKTREWRKWREQSERISQWAVVTAFEKLNKKGYTNTRTVSFNVLTYMHI
jgi:hypothetical protein